MSDQWVPPFHICGECGGEIGRYPVVNLFREVILDWRHMRIPVGVTEHRAVLGTKAHLPQTPAASRGEEEPDMTATPIPPIEEPARRVGRTELPRMALRLAEKAEDQGWLVQQWYMRGPSITAAGKFRQVSEVVVVRAKRYGHMVTASWTTLAGHEEWAFEEAWSAGAQTVRISSVELDRIIMTRARCEACGKAPECHIVSDSGPICQ